MVFAVAEFFAMAAAVGNLLDGPDKPKQGWEMCVDSLLWTHLQDEGISTSQISWSL